VGKNACAHAEVTPKKSAKTAIRIPFFIYSKY